MKKFILGFGVALLLSGAGYALAAGGALSLVDTLTLGNPLGKTTLQKVYDSDTNTLCYVVTGGGPAPAISCLKNTGAPATTTLPTTRLTF